MKIKNLFALLSLSAVMSLGVGAGIAFNSDNEVKADGTTLYCKMTYDWWKADDAAIGAHYWGGVDGTSWPGVRMSKVATDTDVWKIVVPSGHTNIIFTRVNGSGDIADWGAKTADLDIPTNGNNLYTITSSSAVWGDPGVTGSWSTYEEPAPVDPTTINYSVKVGDGEWQDMVYYAPFTYDTDKTGYRFRVGGKTANSGTLVQFKKESEAIYPGASDFPFGNANNLRWSSSPNELRVRNGCSSAVLDLFVYEDGYDSYLGGYVANEQTYYFSNNKGWEGAPKYYAFYDNDNKQAAWPGTDMTFASVDGYGQSTYSFTVDINRYPNVILTNQAGSSQTDDLEFAHFTDDGVYLTGDSSPYGVAFYHYSEPIYSLQVGGSSYTLHQNEGSEYIAEDVNLTAGATIGYSYDGVTVDDSVAKPVSNNNVSLAKKIIASANEVDVYVDISTKTIWAPGLPSLSNGYHLYVNTTVHTLTYDSGVPQYYSSLISFAANDELRYIHIDDDMAPVIFGNAEIEGGPAASNFEWSSVKGCIVATAACNASIYFKQGSPNNVWFETASPQLVAAKDYASGFNTALGAVCQMSGESDRDDLYDAWEAQKAVFDSLAGDVKIILMNATSSHDVEEIADFIAKYELIARKYGTYFATKDANYNFLGKSITPLSRTGLFSEVTSSSMIAITSILAFVSISSIAVLVLYKKKRHN